MTLLSRTGPETEAGSIADSVPGLKEVWTEQSPVIGLVVAYTFAVYLAERVVGLTSPLRNVGFANFYFLFALSALCYALASLALARWRIRDPEGRWLASWSAWKLAWTECRRLHFTPYRAGTVVVIAVAMLLLLRTYSSWKPLIPLVVPYGELDMTLMRLDAALHFGEHPWRLLQPLLGHAPITLAIDLLYALWLPVNFVVLLWQAASTSPHDRGQFILTYALVWIVVGTIMATLLASVGPCYFGRVLPGANPYADQMAYLEALHASPGLIALQIQENLWTFYTGREILPLNGISAMPSVHVAGATLFALAGWRAGRAIGIALTLYAVVILAGSVHLAWHYAVDGYVAAPVTLGLWWMSGRVLSRKPARPR